MADCHFHPMSTHRSVSAGKEFKAHRASRLLRYRPSVCKHRSSIKATGGGKKKGACSRLSSRQPPVSTSVFNPRIEKRGGQEILGLASHEIADRRMNVTQRKMNETVATQNQVGSRQRIRHDVTA